ncbi:fungal-specific transcription factor domain-containing protein [Lophiotrema nucula]|uniref:Fungal-specific transcription factor domain-containing protein n=1 Tax=Lophiotrema nucula TaxID=690887 RepID=A0A6A5ZBR2_9PLEO|nr:fungal-specific transcription factor domain-containing protein [Lophiotrema nucula]
MISHLILPTVACRPKLVLMRILRPGCITCKAKRLKCDETKPTCQQCARRNVACGGYKKDFKWRPFEEMNFSGKPPGKSKKVSSPPTSAPVPVKAESPAGSDDSQRTILHSAPLHHMSFPPPQSPAPITHGLPLVTSFHESPYPPVPGMYSMPQPSPFMMAPPQMSPMEQFAPGSVDSSSTMFEVESIDTRQTGTTAPSSVTSGQSPRLVDLLLPGTDLSVPPEEYLEFRSQYPESLYLPSGLTPPPDLQAGADMDTGMLDTDDIEEVPRLFDFDRSNWNVRMPSPTPSSSSSSSTDSNSFPMLMQPQFSITSPEMLTRRFDRDTCGILSVKDGPTENPWRTLVWPLARDCPALYHAIASMTSFHQSKDIPAMRIQGIDHMRTSVHALASTLQNMRVDAAISTTLVLAFSESWDSHISTGINHIKGAKLLINKAITQHEHTPLGREEFSRMKFLCNAWMYMDVIARLTSADDDENNDFDLVSDSIFRYDEADGELDPLMGCATTLFPIVGRVANLVRRVRRSDSNGPSIISQAMQLKGQLERWTPPSLIEDPEDVTTSKLDVLGTAEAYRHATLLYLHQAVPEMPSLSSAELAKKVMQKLATVEPKSRAVIVQIYPLMAAGCEAMDEDRTWVQDRWESMQSRMKLGIIEKCLEVTKEVWNRRDAYTAESPLDELERIDSFSPTISLKREFSSLSDDYDLDSPFAWLDEGDSKRRATAMFDIPQPVPIKQERRDNMRRVDIGTELLDLEFTVKGRLHWLGVMKDWQWEVLLG